MDKSENLGHDKYEEERELWNVWCEVHRSKGIDTKQLLVEWCREETQKLRSPGAREDFAELCDIGCNPLALAACMTLARYSPSLQPMWTFVGGKREERQKATRVLENAAATLDKIFAPLMAVGDEKDRAKFAQIGRVDPQRMVSELRLYTRAINLAELLSEETKAHSLLEVSKYLLSSYVERAAGRPHDRNVSGIIGEVLGQEDYNEVAHRMWRNRNYDRLEEHLSVLPEFLVAMSSVIGPPAA